MQQVMDWGYDFYQHIISEEDFQQLQEINNIGSQQFYSVPLEKSLAVQLNISVNTVQYHKKQLIRKTNTSNITQAVHYLLLNGYI